MRIPSQRPALREEKRAAGTMQPSAAKEAGAGFFLDIKEAFYSLVRELVMDLSTSDDAAAWILKSLNLPDTAFQELAELLHQPPLLTQAAVSDHLHHLIAETHPDTWWMLRKAPEPAHAMRGASPGRPLASEPGDVGDPCHVRHVIRTQEALKVEKGKGGQRVTAA